ncbi:MAG: globin [Candidatus Solibacter sp.]|nr:globin [Candidatus Solibacter sp.]
MAIYDAIGGMETCRRLAAAFYARVERDPVLRPVYPPSLHCAVQSIALFIAQHFGGPCEYSRQRSSLSLFDTHLRFRIGEAERDAWVANMVAAMDDAGIAERERAEMAEFFREASRHLINRPPNAEASTVLPLDEAVAAVRRGDVERVAELADCAEFRRDRAAWIQLLATMAGSEDSRVLSFALARISAEPGIIHERFTYDGTLLHAAAGAGCLPMVELLLVLGADPNARDRFGHTPLYAAGNSCFRGSAGRVVRALVEAGADVNAQDRVKRCAPLHAAARRGNIAAARALLESGADTGVRDRNGATPLDRALNCKKAEVAELLRINARSTR